MAEKGELPPDNISLPPNYAPSEVYTESPPPAYRKEKSVQVYMTRMICMTVLTAALLCGFFITFSSWINARACNCEATHTQTVSDPIRAAGFIGLESSDDGLNLINEIDANVITNDKIEQKLINDKKINLQQDIEISNPDLILSPIQQEEEEKAEVDLNQNEIESIKKKIKLPIDMLLENPALAGKDIQCEVEKKIQNIGGFPAQAIFVTCRDEEGVTSDEESDEEDSSFKPKESLKPPTSFLGHIMKIIAAKRRSEIMNSMVNNPMKMAAAKRRAEIMNSMVNKPKIIVHPLSGSIPRPLEHNMQDNGPQLIDLPRPQVSFPAHNLMNFNNVRQIQGPFMTSLPQIIESGTVNNPIRRFDGKPIMGPLNGLRNGPFNGPVNGPFNGPFNGPVNVPFNGPFNGPPNVPFNGPPNVHFNGPPNVPFNGPPNVPFNGPPNVPFNGPPNVPFNGPSNVPFNRPMNGPFNAKFIRPVNMQPNMPFNGPQQGPFNGPINVPFIKPINGPFNEQMSAPEGLGKIIPEGVLEQIIQNLPLSRSMEGTPVIRIEERRALPFRPFGNGPPPFIPIQRQAPNLPFIRPIPNELDNQHMNDHHHHDEHHNNEQQHHHEELHHIEQPHHHEHEQPHFQEMPPPPPPPMFNQEVQHPRNNRVLEEPEKPEPIVGQKTEIFPFPLPKNVFPLQSFPSPGNERMGINRSPKMIKLFPFNIRSLRLLSGPSPLLTPDAPYQNNNEESEELKEPAKPFIMSPDNFLPLARGLPPPPEDLAEDNEELPSPFPEASGRALPAPISLKFLPGKLFRLPLAPGMQSLPRIFERRLDTHMELRQAPEIMEEEPQQPDPNLQPPAIPVVPLDNGDTPDFGPPKDHSIMEEIEEEQREQEFEEAIKPILDSMLPNFPPQFPPIPQVFTAKHPNPPFLGSELPPPPPPFMRPEGRIGKILEINPDSEIISMSPIQSTPPQEESHPAEVPQDSTAVHSSNRHVILLN